MVGINEHAHAWSVAAVASVIRRTRPPEGLSEDDGELVAFAKILYLCDVCGETRQELYEGPPEGVPKPPVPEEIRMLDDPAAAPSRIAT